MPAGTDLLFFNDSADWKVVADVTRRAIPVGESSHIPIPAFDLGLSLNTDYVAVVVTCGFRRDSWQFAGDINQVYNFAPGGSSPLTGKIQPVRTRLFLDKLTLVETNRVSTDPFDLRFKPPYWFKDCAIRVYQYVGQKLNFVEDALFNIGNALGVDPNREDGRIIEGLLALKLDLENQTQVLTDLLDTEAGASEQSQQELIIEVEQLKAGVYTLSEGLANLLPQEQAQQLTQNTQDRLNLDLGFL